jgi:hypothetical protein
MPNIVENNLPLGSLLSFRAPAELRRELERDASHLGVSVSDVIRMRLRSGHIPKFDAGAALVGLPTHLSALETARAANHLKV